MSSNSKKKTRKSRSLKTNQILKQTVFTQKDYDSNDGMLTTVWGPSMWHFLHTMSFNYPVHPKCNEKQHYYNFMLSLRNILPCGKCRKNLCSNLKKLPLKQSDMKSRDTFSRYVYNLHELINDMLGKKSGLTYEEIKERYEHFRSRCAKSHKDLKLDLKKRKTMKKLEKGCTDPLYGEKSKCILQIVPQNQKCETFQVDETCIKKTLYHL